MVRQVSIGRCEVTELPSLFLGICFQIHPLPPSAIYHLKKKSWNEHWCIAEIPISAYLYWGTETHRERRVRSFLFYSIVKF